MVSLGDVQKPKSNSGVYMISKEDMESLYEKLGLSPGKIAQILGVPEEVVKQAIQDFEKKKLAKKISIMHQEVKNNIKKLS